MKRELIEKGKLLEPSVRIGKNGLTDGTVSEIKKQLKVKKLVKVKFLKPALGEMKRKEFANLVASKTDSELVNQVGFVVVLFRR